MPPRLSVDADALAGLRLRVRVSRDPLDRAASLYLDSDGTRIAVDLPAPRDVARYVALPGVDAFRQGAGILTRPQGSREAPTPVALPDLVDDLREALRALPSRSDALGPYADLRRALSIPSATVEEYLLRVVRAFREDLPTPPRAPARGLRPARDEPKSNAQTLRESRSRRRADEEASSRLWLVDGFLDPGDPPAPGAYALADLHAEAIDTLGDWRDAGETLPDGREITEPGPRIFDSVLRTSLGDDARTRTNRGVTYTVNPQNTATARAILDRAARMLLDDERAAIAAVAAEITSPAPYVDPLASLLDVPA